MNVSVEVFVLFLSVVGDSTMEKEKRKGRSDAPMVGSYSARRKRERERRREKV